MSSGSGGFSDEDDFANEPPLLVELGVDFTHIRAKVWGVLNISKTIGGLCAKLEVAQGAVEESGNKPRPAALDMIDLCIADPALMADADMAGPLLFALILGFALLMVGKLHFGYIYGFGMLGCLAIYLLVNLMAGASQVAGRLNVGCGA